MAPKSVRVELDVGGRRFATSLTTLCSAPGMLEAMFSGRTAEPHRESDGSYFIDRDGTLFEHILAFLRNGERWRPPAGVDTVALANEAEYFALLGMVEILRPAAQSSVVLDNCKRVGPVLCLIDPKKSGCATFSPSNPDAFSVQVKFLGAQPKFGPVLLTLRDTRTGDGWCFRTSDRTLRFHSASTARQGGVQGGDCGLFFGPGPHVQPNPLDLSYHVSKAGDTVKLSYVRGPPSRFFVTWNGLESDENVSIHGQGRPVPTSGQGSLPMDGNFVIEVYLRRSCYTLPTFENDEEGWLDIFEPRQQEDYDRSYEDGAERAVELCSNHNGNGSVLVHEWAEAPPTSVQMDVA